MMPSTDLALEADIVLAVVAHPHDETLAMGATLAALAHRGMRVHVLTLTAGEAAFDHLGDRPAELAHLRAEEFARAARRLSAAQACLGSLPDGRLSEASEQASAYVRQMAVFVGAQALFTVAGSDPHPDHACTGQVVRDVGADLDLPVTEFLLWAQYRCDPAEFPHRFASVAIDPNAARAKRAALGCYRSQTRPFRPGWTAAVPDEVQSWPYEAVVTA